MSIMDDVKKLALSLLSLDDIVLVQALGSNSKLELGRGARFTATSLAAATNLVARGVGLSLQLTAKTAGATAGTFENVVPGAQLARSLAEKAGDESMAVGEQAARLVSYAIQLTNGDKVAPPNPLSKDPWMGKGLPYGYNIAELAGETVTGTLARLAMMPLTLAYETSKTVASVPPGAMALDSALLAVNTALDTNATSKQSDRQSLREVIMAVASGAGGPAVCASIAMAEAAARLAVGDVSGLRKTLEEGLDEMSLLAKRESQSELMENLPISSQLRERARLITENQPNTFLAALQIGPGGETPKPADILSAMFTDANALSIFFTCYPQALTLMSGQAASLLTTGLKQAGEAPLLTGDTPEDEPVTALETYIESAMTDGKNQALAANTLLLAQDEAFVYARGILGEEKALARAFRLFGEDVSTRLADDVSLDDALVEAAYGPARNSLIQDYIRDEEQVRLQDRLVCAQDRLTSLDAYNEHPLHYKLESLNRRTSALRTFISMTNQHLAEVAGNVATGSQRLEFLDQFQAWAQGETPAVG